MPLEYLEKLTMNSDKLLDDRDKYISITLKNGRTILGHVEIQERHHPKCIITSDDDFEVETVDLTNLANTPIEIIAIGENDLEAIDITPLEKCPELRELYLHKNLIENIDLEPLKGCTNLRKINLGHNPIISFDLEPLRSHPSLEELILGSSLEKIDFQFYKGLLEDDGKSKPLPGDAIWRPWKETGTFAPQIDVSPLFECPNLRTLEVHPDTKLVAHHELSHREAIPKGLQKHLDRIEYY